MSKVHENPKLILHWKRISNEWEASPWGWFIKRHAGGFYSTKHISTSAIGVIMSASRLVLSSNSGDKITFRITDSEARIFRGILEYHIYTYVSKEDVANPNWIHVIQDNGFG